MNKYKRQQFINLFKINSNNFIIDECPNSKVPIISKYVEEEHLIKAYLYKDECNKCRYNKKCIKQDFDDIYYEVVIKKEVPDNFRPMSVKLKYSDKVINKSLKDLLRMQLEFEIGEIDNCKKKRGKKYEDGVIAYDGDYLEYNSFRNKIWYCHGYGKAYYEDGSLEYEGKYLYGNPHGYGKYYYRNGQIKWSGIFEGIYTVGKNGLEAMKTAEGYADRKGRIKYGKSFSLSGNLEYEGEFKLGKAEGDGKLYNKNKQLVYSGEFRNGKPLNYNKFKKVSKIKGKDRDIIDKLIKYNPVIKKNIKQNTKTIIEEFKSRIISETLEHMDIIYVDI